MATFADLAKMKPEDLPTVKLMPIGYYIWQTVGVAEVKASSRGDGTLINFKCKCVRPSDDMDPADLEDFGNPAGQVRTLMFYVPDQPKADEEEAAFNNRQAAAIQRLSKFMTNDLGLEPDQPMAQISMSAGYMFMGQITHELDNRDNETWRERFGSTAPVE